MSCVNADIGNSHKLTATIEPLRYFTDQIAGDQWQTTTLVPQGFSPEEYTPSAQQIADLSESAALITAGRLPVETAWGPKAQTTCPTLIIVDTSAGLTQATFDPHTWTSPRNALLITESITNALCQIDSTHAAQYTARLQHTHSAIHALHTSLTQILDTLPSRTFVIAHPALTQFAADYNLHQLAIESDGKEPTPATLQALITQAKAEHTKIVFVQKEFASRSAHIVADQINAQVVEINPLSYDWEKELLHIANALKNAK